MRELIDLYKNILEEQLNMNEGARRAERVQRALSRVDNQLAQFGNSPDTNRVAGGLRNAGIGGRDMPGQMADLQGSLAAKREKLARDSARATAKVARSQDRRAVAGSLRQGLNFHSGKDASFQRTVRNIERGVGTGGTSDDIASGDVGHSAEVNREMARQGMFGRKTTNRILRSSGE